MKTVGIVGAGFISHKHASGMMEFDNVRLGGVADIDAEKQNQLISQYGGTAYQSFEDMLADPKIDIIDICLPTPLHHRFAMQAIKEHKAVLLEKPIALSYEEAKAIAEAAKKENVPFMVGQSLRFKSEYMAAKSILESGIIGTAKRVYAARLGQKPSWRNWTNGVRKTADVVYDLMLHDVDFAYSLFGNAESVFAVGTEISADECESVSATVQFSNGVAAVFDANTGMPQGYPFTMCLRIDATGGTLEYRFIGGKNTEICKESELILYAEGKDPEVISCQTFSNHGKELSYFAECIDKGVAPEMCLPEESVNVMHIMDGISSSVNKGYVKL